MPVTGVPRDEAFALEVGERAPERLAGHSESPGERGEAAATGAADLGEDGQRPAVVAEGDEA